MRLAVPGVSGFHELHALEWGRKRSRRTLVCVHGYSGNAHDFDFLAQSLRGGMRVVCPDMPGRGESGWLASPLHYHFGRMLADVRVLLARLGVGEVDWVGTSMGGLIGMMLASQTSSPIRRLVMNDVGAFLPTDALQYIGRNLDAPAVFATVDDVEAHMRHTHREWSELTDAQWRQLAVHGSRRVPGGWRLHYDPQIAQVVQPMPLMPGLYFWDAWFRVRCPVLLLRGEHSRVFPPEVAQTMLDIKPQARLVEVAGCGHVPALMSAGEVDVVRSFLLETAPSRERRSMPAVSPRTCAP